MIKANKISAYQDKKNSAFKEFCTWRAREQTKRVSWMAAKSAANSDLLRIASKKWPYVGLFSSSGHNTSARDALPMVARMCSAPLCTCNGSKLSCKHLFSLCSTSRTRRMFGQRSMALPSMSADFRLRSSSLPRFGENATDSRFAINLLIWWHDTN